MKPANSPAWHQAACYGRRDAGDLTAINPYAYGSQCWIIYEQARTGHTLSKIPKVSVKKMESKKSVPFSRSSRVSRATSPASVSSVCSVGTSSAA